MEQNTSQNIQNSPAKIIKFDRDALEALYFVYSKWLFRAEGQKNKKTYGLELVLAWDKARDKVCRPSVKTKQSD